MTENTQLQQMPLKNHQGGNIGGVPPKVVSADQKSKAPATIFTVSGNTKPGQIPMVDWYTTAPVVPTAKFLSLGYDLILDPNVAANAWALERDLKLSFQKKTANFSFEIVVAKGWKLQISSKGSGGNWQDPGGSISPLAPNVPHHFLHRFSFDFVKWLYSYLAINIDGQEFTIPNSPDFQNQPFQQTGWGDGALFQFQQDLRPDLPNPSFSETLSNANLTWW